MLTKRLIPLLILFLLTGCLTGGNSVGMVRTIVPAGGDYGQLTGAEIYKLSLGNTLVFPQEKSRLYIAPEGQALHFTQEGYHLGSWSIETNALCLKSQGQNHCFDAYEFEGSYQLKSHDDGTLRNVIIKGGRTL